jgi:excinuclease ABC subunit B
VQAAYNEEHGITPQSTHAPINSLESDKQPEPVGRGKQPSAAEVPIGMGPVTDADLLPEELTGRIAELRAQMTELAKALRYEDAAKVRDRIRVLEARKLEFI